MVNAIDYSVENNEIKADLESLYDSLISILRKETENYRALYSTFVMESEILIRASIDELDTNNSKKETLVLKAKMLDEARVKLIGRMASVLGEDEKAINLSILISRCSEEKISALSDCRKDLECILSAIREINSNNKMLLDSSLAYVKKSINFIGSIMAPGVTYLNTGMIQPLSMTGKLVLGEG